MKIRNQGHFPDADPVDPDQLARDEALLDALGAGAPGPDGDDLAAMLSAWQTSVSTDIPSAVDDAVVHEAAAVAPPRRTRRPLAKLIAALTGATIVLGGSLTAAAAGAGPGSPLWPITRIVYADRADSRAAEQTAQRLVDEATTAFAHHDYADATARLDRADTYLPKITDGVAKQRIAGQIERLRAAIAAVTLPSVGVSPTPQAPGAASSPGTGGTDGRPAESTPAPSPTPSPSQGGLLPLPPLPSLLPSLPILN